MSYYKWYILALATVTNTFLGGAERMCLPPLFAEILSDLGLSRTQMGTIWGMDPLAGVFVSLIAGLLIDRFGLKRTLAAACFLGGVTGALRGLSADFASMAATMFAFGLLVAMTPTLVPKAMAVWFLGQRLALANSILTLGATAGSMLGTMISATVLSPLLGGWRNVLFLYGIPPILLSLLWFVTGREPEPSEGGVTKSSEVPFREALSQVIRIKGIWVVGIISLGAQSAFLGLTGYLPTYLRDIGWAPGAADGALTAVIATIALNTIPMALLSDKLGSRKAVLAPSLFIAAIALGILPLVDGPAVWGLLIVTGLSRGGALPLTLTLVVEQEGVGSKYAGTAVGIMTSISMMGSFLLQLLGMRAAEIYGGGAAFFVWSAISIVTLIGFFFLKEAPWKTSKSAKQQETLRRSDS